MRKIASFYLIFIIVFSCSNNKRNDESNNFVSKKTKINNILISDSIIDLEMLICNEDSLYFYTEKIMRGKGVVSIDMLDLEKRIEILNTDKSCFGRILKNNLGNYEFDLPSNIIAREIIPSIDYNIFSFDAEMPEIDSDYLIVYINKEKKLISKKKTKYYFQSWEEYVKSAFIDNSSSDQIDKNLYKVLKINNDSMLVKSITKSTCDYIDIECYKDVKKWIQWKKNDSLLVRFNFCY